MKHKHSDLIHAWADGAEIQAKGTNGWFDCPCPQWYLISEYRIKPIHKQDDEINSKFDNEINLLKGLL